MKYKFVLFSGILIVALIIMFSSVQLIKLSKYKNDSSYCEKSEDCQCRNCGCFNQYRGELECFIEEEGQQCYERGCQCINNECVPSKIPESGIDTEQKAIEYAKNNREIKNFVKEIQDMDVGYNAFFNKELGVWQVVAYAKNANDVDYQISFYPNGTITFTGPIPV
jgi:hypothetical protein